ncbi:hypothetical protein DMUE_5659 [Dictyocoela muelleri]|nr:hypothetical protein DMUE_5659 [Dictyocoela muelleri]
MFKGDSIYSIEKLINKGLNMNYYRSIRGSPGKIIYRYSEFDIYKNIKSHFPKPKIKNSTEINDLSNNKIETATKVYIKNFNCNKLDDLYIQPYDIIRISKKKLWIKIKGINEWIHINDIKIFLLIWRVQDVVNHIISLLVDKFKCLSYLQVPNSIGLV